MTDLGPLDRTDAWDLTVVSEPFTTGSQDVATAVDRLQAGSREQDWDLVIGLTEHPLLDHEGGHLLVQIDPGRQAAVLSLPALGGSRMHARARRAVRSLLGTLTEQNAKVKTASPSRVWVAAHSSYADVLRHHRVPPVGFEPTPPPPEGGALSPELRGLTVRVERT